MFVIRASNRPEMLGNALLTPGRLDQLIYIPLPDLPARQGILVSNLKKSPVAPNLPMSFLAHTHHRGIQRADLAGVCQYAAKTGIRDALAAEELMPATMPWLPMASARSAGCTSKRHTITLERQY